MRTAAGHTIWNLNNAYIKPEIGVQRSVLFHTGLIYVEISYEENISCMAVKNSVGASSKTTHNSEII
jgi:hypothetical protein